jgi:hypothetical protein
MTMPSSDNLLSAGRETKSKNSPAAEHVGPAPEGRHCFFPGAEIIKRIIKQEVYDG